MSIVLIALCGTGGQQNESEASLKLWASAAAAVAQIPITSHLLPRMVVLVVVVVVGHRGGCSNIQYPNSCPAFVATL